MNKMARTLSCKYEMAYVIKFDTAIWGHDIYKDIWQPLIGQELVY